MGLVFAHVPLATASGEVAGAAVHVAAHVAAVVLVAELLAGGRIDVVHLGADGAKVSHEAAFFGEAGLEKPVHPAVERLAGSPAEVVPQGTLALFAND